MKYITKRIMASVLALVMCLNTCTINTYAQEIKVESGVIETDRYEVVETINSEWQDGYVETIKIKNNSDEVLHNWSIYFELENEITSIWNAQIFYSDDVGYSLNCYEWNCDIKPGEYIEIGFVANGSYKELQEISLFVDDLDDKYEDLEEIESELYYNSEGNIEFTDEQIASIKSTAEEQGLVLESVSDAGMQRAGKKLVVKKVIKWFLENRQKITNLVGKELSPNKAVKFGEALKYMEGPLRKLMYVENAIMGDVRKAIFDGCRKVRMKTKTANEVADFIMKVIDILC